MSTTGIIFLGTPHRGLPAAPWGTIIADCASAFGFDTNTALLKTLQSNDSRSVALLSSFTSAAVMLRTKVWCFYETQKTSIIKGGFSGATKTMVS